MSRTHRSIRVGLLTSTILALSSGMSGCSVFSDPADSGKATSEATSQSQANNEATALWQSLNLVFGEAPAAPARAKLSQLPYPVSYVQFDNEPRSIVVLGATGTHGQYWYSAGNEALVRWQGRVIRTASLKRENLLHSDNLANDPLSCHLHQNAQQNAQQSPQQSTSSQAQCPTSWQRSIEIQRPVENFNPHQPEYEVVRFTLSSELSRESNESRELIEEGTATRTIADETVEQHEFTNTFELSSNGQYVINSRQWLSPKHGYVTLDMVNLAGVNAPRGATKHARIGMPVQTVKGNRAPRLNDFVVALPQQFYPDSYWPGARIYSDSLDERFERRRAGMLKRLRMLAQIYVHDQQPELEAQARTLILQFQRWPLRASYAHGVIPALMQTTLEANPVLNPYDADETYEFVVPKGSNRLQQVGGAAPSAKVVWHVGANGEIRRLERAAALGQSWQQDFGISSEDPGLLFTGIAEKDLPKGFRDINAQLAMFLQHWNYTQPSPSSQPASTQPAQNGARN